MARKLLGASFVHRSQLRAMMAVACCCAAPVASAQQGPDTLERLYTHIAAQGGAATNDGVPIAPDAANPQRTMGFLSLANWHSARHSLPATTLHYLGHSTDDLVAKVQSGAIIGAVINGVPLDPTGSLHTFASAAVTPKAALFKPGPESDTMREAIGASLVRMLAKGKAQQARQNNMPNNYVEVHTCKAQESDWDHFPFPNATNVLAGANSVLKRVLTSRVLKITEYAASAHNSTVPAASCEAACSCVDADNTACASCAGGCVTTGDSWAPQKKCCSCSAATSCTVGADWAQDGDYTVNPPTGFWPEYTTSMLAEFKTVYGSDITLERVWCGWTCTQALLAGGDYGGSDMSAPYFNLDGYAFDRPRVS
jgi:hypothetical protein